MNAATTSLQIPDDLKPADGRFGCGPSKVRPEQLARLAAARRRADGHLAPPGAGQGARRAGPRGPARAVLAARRLRGRARQRRHDRVLGRGGVRPRARARAAPGLRRVLAEVRRRSTAGAPFLADPIVVAADPGDAPDAGRATPSADVIAWAHNETSTGVMVAGARPAGAGDALVLIDATSGAGGLPVDVGRGRRLLLRAAEVLRLRRRAVARAAEPGRASSAIGELGGVRPLDPRRSSRSRPRSRTRARTRPTTRRRSRRCSCSPTRSSGCSSTAASTGCVARTTASSRAPLRLGRARRLRDAVRRRPGQALAGRRHDRLRRRASTPPRSPRRCAPTASSTSSPTASSAATSCAIAMFPAIEPGRRAGADRLHRLGRGADS